MPNRNPRRITSLVAAAFLAACTGDRAPTTATGSPSLASRVAAIGAMKINEVESSGGVPGDWVELYNVSAAPVDVSGHIFRDNNDAVAYVIPAGTIVPANGFLVLEESQFSFGIGSADAARLFLPDGSTLVDSYSWTAHAPTTYGRCPDGTGAFQVTTVTTKGAANDCAPRIVINEVESSGGDPGDWAELKNLGPAPVDLGGYVFRDNSDASNYVIPAGTIIPANGYIVLDEAQFGFGLGSGDAARLFAPGGTALVDNYAWTAHSATTYGRCPDGSGAFTTTSASTKGALNACGAIATTVKINEVESNLGVPGDWVELHNSANAAIDLTGYVFRDNVDAAQHVLPAGSIIPANGFLVLDEAQIGFGLGGGDAARLFAPGGTILLDSYVWTVHAMITYGRCPDGSGAFVQTSASTKGAPNACAPEPLYLPWPGSASVENAEMGGLVTSNLSGLFFEGSRASKSQGPGVLWAVRNGPGALFRLLGADFTWRPDAANGWNTGKLLRYPNGTGDVDAEGVTMVDGMIYVAAERNNSASGVSRNSILRYDITGSAAELVATNEFDVTALLPANGANLGLEAIAYIPDAVLVANGFFDETLGVTYNPASYPNHGSGLFMVGVENGGIVYVFALNHTTNVATRVASFTSGFPQVMDLAYDRELGHLWAVCDNGCNGRSTILRIDTAPGSATRGRFVVTQRFERPMGMPNLNNEGFTIAPLSECVSGARQAFWADDGATSTFSIRRGTVTCSPF